MTYDFYEHRTDRRVLTQDPGIEGMDQYAARNGWPLISELPADPKRGVLYDREWLVQDDLMFHYGIDDVSGNAFFYLNGDDLNEAERVDAEAADELMTWTLEGLAEAVGSATTPAERGRALLRLGLGAPRHFHQRVFDEIKSAVEDEDENIRNAGVYATTYAPLPPYRPLLEQVRRRDPSPQLRESAAAALDAFDREDVTES
jgi:hypothetical protein